MYVKVVFLLEYTVMILVITRVFASFTNTAVIQFRNNIKYTTTLLCQNIFYEFPLKC